MAKAAITKKYGLSAQGVLDINGDVVGLENQDTGELINFADLLHDFADKAVKINVTYDEDFDTI